MGTVSARSARASARECGAAAPAASAPLRPQSASSSKGGRSARGASVKSRAASAVQIASGVALSRALNCHAPTSSSGVGFCTVKRPSAAATPVATTAASSQPPFAFGRLATSSSSRPAQDGPSSKEVLALWDMRRNWNGGT